MRRAPPPTNGPVACQGLWAVLVAGLIGLAASAFMGWSWMQLRQRAGLPVAGALPGSDKMSVLLAIGVLLTVGLYLYLTARPVLRLRWDGAGWGLLAADGCVLDKAGAPILLLDWGDWMLLLWRSGTAQPARWLPMSRGMAGAMAWHALRVAVCAPQQAKAPARGVAEHVA